METKYTAPLLLRAYTWELLKRNTSMKESDYNGMTPIVPLGEEPQIKAFGKPYIVYGYSEDPPIAGVRNIGNMAFAIYGTPFSQVLNLANVLSRTFEREDLTARDVNEFTSTIPAFYGLRFGSISLAYADSGEVDESEGEPVNALVNIRYEYYAEYDVVTSFANWDGTQYVKN